MCRRKMTYFYLYIPLHLNSQCKDKAKNSLLLRVRGVRIAINHKIRGAAMVIKSSGNRPVRTRGRGEGEEDNDIGIQYLRDRITWNGDYLSSLSKERGNKSKYTDRLLFSINVFLLQGLKEPEIRHQGGLPHFFRRDLNSGKLMDVMSSEVTVYFSDSREAVTDQNLFSLQKKASICLMS